jgi:hypothetical protein
MEPSSPKIYAVNVIGGHKDPFQCENKRKMNSVKSGYGNVR